jgi:hypothetical protein
VEAVRLENARGHLVVLPWLGQMIWDATFDGHDLTMRNMFSQPKPANVIVETYGCFAFHSGLLANGCPSAEDTTRCTAKWPAPRWMRRGWSLTATRCVWADAMST